ncbi:unnamed protein product [Protopolystoma xenopodis]|uniref:BAHCC1-like Tudor domain-containing protein n=1 Tax=Protopolystoma xenopodis TaxID=117903 RepID=A0A3S5CNR7_9PLAT|nr:unnamed protein product [Protopolystoma xenopodis]
MLKFPIILPFTHYPLFIYLSPPSSALNAHVHECSRRRQSEVMLFGWQVVQQAVREILVDSIADELRVGSRVCASWSEQLAANLYPGTVVKGLLVAYFCHFACLFAINSVKSEYANANCQ